MFSGNLQARLVFLFFALILLTNSIFSLVAISREKIRLDQELVDDALFLGKSLILPAREIFTAGSDQYFKRILENRSKILSEFKITVYDANWWHKSGDEPRIPPEGFPSLDDSEKLCFRSGHGSIAREIFFIIDHDGKNIGAIGIGIPIVDSIKSTSSSSDFLIILLVNLGIGVVAAVILARSILEPLGGLMEGIDAFADGNYALRVETTGQGELRRLGEAFNRMAATVQENVRENLLRNRMLDEKLQELWEIYEITRNLSFNNELNQILEQLVEKAQTLSFSSNSQIILQNRMTGKLEEILPHHNLPDVKPEDYENSLNMSFLEGQLYEKNSNGYSMIFVPLVSAGRIQGVLFLAKRDRNEYSEGTRRFLQTIAPVAASMIENARLYEELSEWNNNLKNIMVSVNSGMCAFDRKGQIITRNDRFLEFFGLTDSAEQIDTVQSFCKSLSDRIFADQVLQAAEGFLMPVPAESCLHRRIRFKTVWHGHDFERDLEIRMMPLLDQEEVSGAVAVIDDITEQNKFEQQMVESEKWAVLGRLAASVAHEIRNPLVAIRSLVEIIGENVSGDLKEHVEVILGEVFRLNRVVAELLSLVRPETAQMQYAVINSLINELLLLVRYEAAKNNIVIITSLPQEEYRILMDTEKIKQAFLNIILNAIQAVGNGGEIAIGLTCKNDQVVVSFRNDGPQIPDEILERIFEPFFTTKTNGTGLGLAITRKIAELHHGSIEIVSSPDMTEFNFALPLEAGK